MKHPDPQSQALDLLRAELDYLQRHALLPTQQGIIRRLIARPVELRPIFEQLWDPAHLRPTRASGSTHAPRLTLANPDARRIEWTPDEYAETLKCERLRLLLTIIATAADIPRRAADRRRALRELPKLLGQLGTQAQALHATLEAIRRHALDGGVRLPARLGPELLGLLTEAANCSPNRQKRYFFESHALPELEHAFDAGGTYWPDLVDVLYALNTASPADLWDHTTEGIYPITRQAHPLNDFLRALKCNLAVAWLDMETLKQFTFTPYNLATLAAVCLDLDPDALPEDPRPR